MFKAELEDGYLHSCRVSWITVVFAGTKFNTPPYVAVTPHYMMIPAKMIPGTDNIKDFIHSVQCTTYIMRHIPVPPVTNVDAIATGSYPGGDGGVVVGASAVARIFRCVSNGTPTPQKFPHATP